MKIRELVTMLQCYEPDDIVHLEWNEDKKIELAKRTPSRLDFNTGKITPKGPPYWVLVADD